jgi:hypothetical protein
MKKLRKAKMQLSLEIRQRPVVVAGFRRACLVESGRNAPDPIRSSLIMTILAISGQIWLDSAGSLLFWPDRAGF